MLRRAISILPWLAVIILAFVAYRYFTRSKDFAARIAASESQTSAAIAAKDSIHHAVDSLAKASVARQSTIDSLSHSATAANAEAADLRSELAIIKRPAPTDSTNPAWEKIAIVNEGIAAAETARADSTGKAFQLLGVDRDAWKSKTYAGLAVIDTLTSALITSQGIVHDQALASSDKCRIVGLIPCPSRTETMIATVVGTLVIHNNSGTISRAVKSLIPAF